MENWSNNLHKHPINKFNTMKAFNEMLNGVQDFERNLQQSIEFKSLIYGTMANIFRMNYITEHYNILNKHKEF